MTEPRTLTITTAAWLTIVRANRENARKGHPGALRWVIEHDAPKAMYLHSLRVARRNAEDIHD
jgi:hypothetical protein